MPSQVSGSRPPPSHRTKVTLACDACRKKRVKCSGTAPCSTCVETASACIYDGKSRARRGPRVRRPLQRDFHELAPAPSGAAPTSNLQTVISASTRPDVRPTHPATHAVTHSATLSVDEARVSQDVFNLSDADGEDSVASPDNVPDAAEWRSGLESLISGEELTAADPRLSIDLMSHLLELVYRYTNALVQQIVPASQFFSALAKGAAYRGLVFAICASSVRFSVHSSARASSISGPGIDVMFARLARTCLDDHGHTTRHMDGIKAICVLIDYEASKSRGWVAWVDLATAKGLAQLYRANTKLTSAESQTLDLVDYFLAVTEATHCLGNPLLHPSEDGFGPKRRNKSAEPIGDSPSQRLLHLLRFLSRIQRLCATSFGRQHPPPWKLGSEFRVLHHELETQLIHHLNASYSEADISSQATAAEDLTPLVCSLVCHCCDVELNKSFLPIPQPRNNHTSDQDTASSPRCINFPGAPPLFLVERVNRCESSAEAICGKARDIIDRGGFSQHMLTIGYCCMQSSFVLVNQLHGYKKAQDPKTSENLKFVFMVVAAVSKFYIQGQHWLNTMFRVHDISTGSARAPTRHEGAFDSYFSRFGGLWEPSCVPLDPCALPKPSSPDDEPGNGERQLQHEGSVQDAPRQQEKASSWAQDYAGHLSQYISDDDDQEQEPQPEFATASAGQDKANDGFGPGNDKSVTIEQGVSNVLGDQPTTVAPQLAHGDADILTDGGIAVFGGRNILSPELFPSFSSINMDPGLQSLLLDADNTFGDEQARLDFMACFGIQPP